MIAADWARIMVNPVDAWMRRDARRFNTRITVSTKVGQIILCHEKSNVSEHGSVTSCLRAIIIARCFPPFQEVKTGRSTTFQPTNRQIHVHEGTWVSYASRTYDQNVHYGGTDGNSNPIRAVYLLKKSVKSMIDAGVQENCCKTCLNTQAYIPRAFTKVSSMYILM